MKTEQKISWLWTILIGMSVTIGIGLQLTGQFGYANNFNPAGEQGIGWIFNPIWQLGAIFMWAPLICVTIFKIMGSCKKAK